MKSVQRFWVYVKVGFAGLLGLAVIVILIANRNYHTDVWLFGRYSQVATLWLIAVTAVTSILLFWVLTQLRGLRADWKQVRADQQEEARKRELDERERRLNNLERRGDSSAPEKPV